MSKNRTGLYLGLAVAGAGGYYLYRAGGDVRGAKHQMQGWFLLSSSLWSVLRSECVVRTNANDGSS